MHIKPVVKGNCVEIRSQTGEVLIKIFDNTPLKAIRKTLKLIDWIENPLDMKFSEYEKTH